MNARLVLACALAGGALVLGGGGIASAEGSGRSISFSTDVVRPGDLVEVEAFCDDPEYNPTPIASDILDPAEMREWTHTDPGWHLRMTAKVRADATPEVWPVSFTCDGEIVSGLLDVRVESEPEAYAAIGVQDKVIEPGQEVSDTFTVTARDEPVAQVPVKPQGAPETGSLSPESGDRPVGTAVGVGAVLLGVSGIGAAALARRRRV